MIRIHSDRLRAPGASQQQSVSQRQRLPRRQQRFLPAWIAAAALALAASTSMFASVASAGEEAGPTNAPRRGDFMICVREQGPLDGYGGYYSPERCVTLASLTAGLGSTGFGPAAYWVGDGRKPAQSEMNYRLGNTRGRPEFQALNIEATARTHAPLAIWMLSYNIKDLAVTWHEIKQYGRLVRLDGHHSIGLSALDPGIQRESTGLLAIGVRISLPY